jgi:hypothetical protein
MKAAVKFRVLLVVAVALVVVVSAAVAAGVGPSGSAGSSAAKPRLRLVDGAQLVIVGRGFRSAERVNVTASISGARAGKTLVADGQGTFTARIRTGPACGPMYVVAVGSKGSRAVVRRPAIPAPCGIDPAPGGGGPSS